MKNKYKEVLRSLQVEKKNKREQWYKNIGFGEYNENRFKTKLQQRFLDFEKEKKLKEEKQKRDQQEKRQKAEKYAKFVKEMHWPRVSKIKKQQMDNLKSMNDIKRSHEIRQSLNASSQSAMANHRLSSNRSQRNRIKKHPDYLSASDATFTNLQK